MCDSTLALWCSPGEGHHHKSSLGTCRSRQMLHTFKMTKSKNIDLFSPTHVTSALFVQSYCSVQVRFSVTGNAPPPPCNKNRLGWNYLQLQHLLTIEFDVNSHMLYSGSRNVFFPVLGRIEGRSDDAYPGSQERGQSVILSRWTGSITEELHQNVTEVVWE